MTVKILYHFLLHHLEFKKIHKLKKSNIWSDDEEVHFEETCGSSQVQNDSEKEQLTNSLYIRKDAAMLPIKGFPLTESEFQAKVMKYLIKQDQRLESIEKILLNLTSSTVGVTKEISPVCDLTELHNLEKRIEDEEEFNKLVLSLSAAGGKDVKDFVKNIMESVVTYDVLAKFNFRVTNRLEKNKEPRPSKEAFKSLNICKIVCCAAMKDRKFF
ncbi:uncharacterized protein LOC105849114 isoform X2 [Hydra vulgaris]|uniref:uncharacterized protein LOC105849114 isoform X2 n=1 Tax=Hydra vulgaris TaxID=6087 RepID=UPI001F5E7477|nr:uncharacterized protein LOC105849114 isoform X3 [Hydra vulgaris]